MSKRTTFTTISPLPPGVSRKVVLDFLHNHEAMIDLNPLVIERHPLPIPPSHCPDEERQCTWWSMTDNISYMPGVKSDLTYTAAFQDLHDGLRTHCYAPMGTHIRERWSLGGTLPGEPKQPVELGLGVPSQGLYLREDVEVRCNFLMVGFVKKTILKAHGVLCDRLVSRTMTLATPPLLSPFGPLFHDGLSASSDGRSSSAQGERKSYLGGGGRSGASTPQNTEQPPPNQAYPPPYQHRHQQSNGGLQPFYGHYRAAASETVLVPESLRTELTSGQSVPHSRQNSGQVHIGQGWQAQKRLYVHDPHNPSTQPHLPQIPPLGELGNRHGAWPNGMQSHQQGAPIAELSGSETHIAELQ